MSGPRLVALRALLAERLPQAQALLVAAPENRRYLSRFRGDTGLLWVTPTDAAILTDARFWAQAEAEAPDWRLVRVEKAETVEFIARLCAEAGVTALAFEPEQVSYATYRAWRRGCRGVRLLPAPDLLGDLRLVKDAEEVAAIRRSAALTDEAFAAWLPAVRAGETEAALAAEFEYRLRRAGADGVSFPPIIAAGPGGAMAHAIPGPRPLQAGEVVVVDVGAVWDGYCSDMTRTVRVPGGAPPADAAAVWDTVRRALDAGVAAVRPGATGVEVDAAARGVIAAAGYGGYFGHGTGHGVGLAVHERPRLSPLADPRVRLPEGAVVTVEPGVYLPGRFGVRLEQLVLVGAAGAEVLSGTPLGF